MAAYFKSIFKLFLPLVIANFGLFSLSFVDSIMLGHANAEHVGLQSIGDAPISLILLILNGLLQGTLFTTAEALGKNDFKAVGQSFRGALHHGAYLSLIAIPCFLFAPDLISLFNYTPEQTHAAATVSRILSAAIPFSILFFLCMFFLNGIKKTWVITVFVIVGNLLNWFGDWVLIEGLLGFPKLLSIGVAYSTTVVRMFMGCGLLLYILLHPEFKKFEIWNKTADKDMNQTQKTLGYSATANMVSYELGAAFCLFFASQISILSASAYTLSYRVFILSNIIGSAFAIAGTILSGKYVHRDNYELRKIYLATASANSLIMFPLCLVCFFFAYPLAGLLTSDAQLQALTAPLLQVISLAMFMRALNSVQIILLRNMRYLLIPSIWYGLSFSVLIPLSCLWWGSLFQTVGIAWALTFGNSLAVIILSYLFLKKTPSK